MISTYTPRHDLHRLDGWQPRLIALANDWRRRPFSYGVVDCGQFMLADVEAVTGEQLMPGVVWPTGWLGIAKFMMANDWATVEAVMDDLLPPMDVSESRRGDVVSFERGGELHLAVRVGDEALSPGIDGLVNFPRQTWRRAWMVGAE